MTKGDILKVLDEIYDYCSDVSDCDDCILSNPESLRCCLKGIPKDWDMKNVIKSCIDMRGE